ncbi:hypothetical protein [Elioraea sp.]|uniref:hypothetical protein n=1 Tax=Elioraea sp. TaxID=2185103 RepID=UPI0025C475C9|nr:hypothetical protein [Elioraea sp.]
MLYPIIRCAAASLALLAACAPTTLPPLHLPANGPERLALDQPVVPIAQPVTISAGSWGGFTRTCALQTRTRVTPSRGYRPPPARQCAEVSTARLPSGQQQVSLLFGERGAPRSFSLTFEPSATEGVRNAALAGPGIDARPGSSRVALAAEARSSAQPLVWSPAGRFAQSQSVTRAWPLIDSETTPDPASMSLTCTVAGASAASSRPVLVFECRGETPLTLTDPDGTVRRGEARENHWLAVDPTTAAILRRVQLSMVEGTVSGPGINGVMPFRQTIEVLARID